MRTVIRSGGLVAAFMLALGASAADDFVYKDEAGRTRVKPPPVPAELVNPWPKDWEDAFWDRANAAIKANAKPNGYGNSYFENEKQMYPNAMFAYIGGFREPALKALQEEDNQATSWNSLTEGIDYFPCFTLKGQMRKYFLFGPVLDPAYRARMKKGAKLWTEKDPLRRPNPFWKKQKEGWTPETMNSWVDVRTTDNLQAMREVSVYLMAEETGNEETRRLYAGRIRDFVVNLYQVGMGEWDSANYHGHTFTAYLNLYDFARDPGVRAQAKAALDYMAAVGAVKYWRGSFTGPSRREYNHTTPKDGGAADHLGLYFGDYPGVPEKYEKDQVHILSSAYRPPAAVVKLARREFPRPVELLIAHPHYDALRKGADAPEFHETTYVANRFQLGTLAEGTGTSDINGFTLALWSSARGSEFFIANATRDPFYIGAPQYGPSQIGRMNIGQYRNVCLVLNSPGDSPFLFQAPKTAAVEVEKGIVFIRFESAWAALHPVNLRWDGMDAEATAKLAVKKPGEQVLAAQGTANGPVCGFALEVGEEASHGDFAGFKKAVLAKSALDLAELKDGAVAFTGAKGEKLKVKFDAARPAVWRQGVLHEWSAHQAQYQGADAAPSPIKLGWKTVELAVSAGGDTFVSTVSTNGLVTQRVK